MKSRYRIHKNFHLITCSLVLFIFIISACNVFPQSASPIEAITFSETVENYPQAEVIFQVKLPAPISDNETLVLEILDEVTGTFFNPSHYEMAAQDAQNYFIRIPLTVGQKIKYRFMRKGTQSLYEYSAQNKQIQFRVLMVSGPSLVQDLIAGWSDQPYTGPVGRIRGQLIDKANNSPIPNMAVYAAGMKTITASDGTFILEALPVWTQNIVITSLDGAYETFQQGALIAEEATTPVLVSLQKRPVVNVVFEVKTPDGFDTNLPLRLASNLYSLGFTDRDLGSGSSMASSNLPVFTQTSHNLYSLTLSLPVGTDLKYKFTFGDGFWNAELNKDGNFVIRQLIVPSSNVTISKKIESMSSPNTGEITFNLSTPETTPVNEQVSLQLNPFGWMYSLPMVKTGENQWSYTIYTPTHLLANVEYRFCRNDRCEYAISDQSQNGFFTGINNPQTLSVAINNWNNMTDSTTPTSVDTGGGTVLPRTDFIAGFELINDLPVTWSNSIDQGLKSISSTGANWVVLSPTWSITNTNPPLLEPVTGSDLLWSDLQSAISKISTSQLQPVLFPLISDNIDQNLFWTNAKKDGGWWQSFFDRYQRFILQNADLANVMNASAILIGDPGMRPAMGGGTLANGESSNPPANADEQWSQLILDIRNRYNGPIIGVVSIPDKNTTLPGWLKNVDGIYVLFSPSLNESGDQSVNVLRTSIETALDTLVQPLASQFGKPIILGLNVPSTQTAITGCMTINDSCLDYEMNNLGTFEVDLDLQAKIYNAAIIASANRSWINGFIARGFDPTVVTKDQSSSVFGKPASDVIWFWYHFILNKSS